MPANANTGELLNAREAPQGSLLRSSHAGLSIVFIIIEDSLSIRLQGIGSELRRGAVPVQSR